MCECLQSLCCCRGTAKLRASCSHQTGGGRGQRCATPPDSFSLRCGDFARFLTGHEEKKGPTWKKSFSSLSNIPENMSHIRLISTEIFIFLHVGFGPAQFSLSLLMKMSHWIRIIRQFRLTIKAVINYTSPFFVSSSPCDVARPKRALNGPCKFKWTWKLLIFLKF